MSETRACPYCGEQVLSVAIKCKHCQSAIGPPTANSSSGADWKEANEIPLESVSKAKATPLVRPGFVKVGAVILVLIGAGLVYNYSRTGSVTGNGYSDEDVAMIEKDIREQYEKQRGMTVDSVSMIRETPTHLTGFVKVKVPILGLIMKNCSATRDGNGQSIWKCE
jgi:hypothetical protein